MAVIKIIPKTNPAAVQEIKGNSAALSEEAIVQLGVGANTVVEVKQEEDKLVVVLSNGEVITVSHFFDPACVAPNAEKQANTQVAADVHDTSGNQLLIEDGQENLIWAKTHFDNGCLAPVEYYAIESTEPLLNPNVDNASSSFLAGTTWLIPLLAYGSVAAIAAVGINADDDNTTASAPSIPAQNQPAQSLIGTAPDEEQTSNDASAHDMAGGAKTLEFSLLDANQTAQEAVNFHVGAVGADKEADTIDLSQLLESNTTVDDLLGLVSVSHSGNDTVVSVDTNGNGQYDTQVVTLRDVSTDLDTLLANHQLIV
ncbi:BapA/Bap/LapF family prefix-like domain-containing protein [Stenoxybacter acetivorans]|uniref:BapA/Bap/LapF family prefix-like domain-containing protein n=1 Tax=Stenoxybacter acetivorans TaxID=422441 RepID=UPI00056D5E97|nr:BapA prefix-like domain-containing protein [Stenoxybacter acetivorans]